VKELPAHNLKSRQELQKSKLKTKMGTVNNKSELDHYLTNEASSRILIWYRNQGRHRLMREQSNNNKISSWSRQSVLLCGAPT
jgi:hypothetical protein